MGNQLQRCCRNCMKLQLQEFTLQTRQIYNQGRYMQISGNFTKCLRCRKFYISSQSIQRQKINELLIFTDASLTMSIPNFNLKLKQQELEKLEEALRYEIYNNNLVLKQNCFVLNAIEEEIDSQYGEFKEFPSSSTEMSPEQQDKESERNGINSNDEHVNQNVNVNENMNVNENDDKNKNITQTPNKQSKQTKQKLRNQIQQFTLRNKSRAFRFKNPLKNYSIGQIIVAIVPVFQKTQDLNSLKQAIQQGLSMCEDMRAVGVSEISFMLGYEQSVFQKIIIEYILGYSRSRKEYVFKRMSQFVYLTRSNQQISNFFNLLNIYSKNQLNKTQNKKKYETQKQRTNLKKLGNINKDTKNSNNNKIRTVKVQSTQPKKIHQFKGKPVLPQRPTVPPNNNPLPPSHQQNTSFNIHDNSLGNTSFHSYTSNHLTGLDRQRIHNNSQSFINLSRRSSNQNQFFNNNLNDSNQIRSGKSDSSEVKNIRVRSFKSKQSNVSDYF